MNYRNLRIAFLSVAAMALIVGCSELPTSREQPAQPTFSLVGAPDRDVSYDLTISGPGMSNITREIDRTTGSVEISVPAGRDREFEFLAQDDVYSGRTTRSLGPGRTVNVDVSLVPGPVIPDRGNTRIVQIRDLAIEEPLGGLWRTVDNGELEFGMEPVDAAYGPDGRLWVANS